MGNCVMRSALFSSLIAVLNVGCSKGYQSHGLNADNGSDGSSISTPLPSSSVPPIPNLDNWKARMISGGRQFCDEALINSAINSTGVTTEGNVWYYDGSRVYQQIAAYTGDNSFYTCAGYANNAYRSFVLAMTDGQTAPIGRMNGWRIFPHGLYMDYLRNGDMTSKEAVRRLALYSAFAGVGGGAHCGLSRETAYIIQAYIHYEKSGFGRHPLLATAVDYALGHIDQWVVSRTCPGENTQPFMMGLTAAALIEYYELTKDPRIQSAIETLIDGMWNLFWVPASTAFVYDTVGSTPAPDLNLLIAPAYAWMWQMTGDPICIERGDQVFTGGTLNANFWTGKQFSQSYRWSFDYVKWRSAAAGTYK